MINKSKIFKINKKKITIYILTYKQNESVTYRLYDIAIK